MQGIEPTLLSGEDHEVSLFIRHYYEHLADNDRETVGDQPLLQRARRHRELAQRRQRGEILVGVDNAQGQTVVYVVADDMPFLVDSAVAAVVSQGSGVELISHPIFLVSRDAGGSLKDLERAPTSVGAVSGETSTLPVVVQKVDGDGRQFVESWTSIKLTKMLSEDAAQELTSRICSALEDVASAYRDKEQMRELARQAVSDAMKMAAVPGPQQESARQARDLLEWMLEDHFIFLGYREYDLLDAQEPVLRAVEGSGVGILSILSESSRQRRLSPAGFAMATSESVLTITKANRRSTVHRSAYLDYVSLKTYDVDGVAMREKRFIGLFAERVYSAELSTIPVLNRKVEAVQKHFGFARSSHSGGNLMAILQTYPRDELFQVSVEELNETILGILQLEERRRTRLFLRRDASGRFASALVYLPRDRFSTSVRLRVQKVLEKTFATEDISFTVSMSESALTRLFFRLRLTPESPTSVDAQTLEDRLGVAVRSWGEGYEEASQKAGRTSEIEAWQEAFPADYRVAYQVEDAVEDAGIFSSLVPSESIDSRLLFRPIGSGRYRLKLYVNQALSLSQILPLLHQFGLTVLEERPYEVRPAGQESVHLYDLIVLPPSEFIEEGLEERLGSAISAQLTGQAESDPFDRLIVTQGLPWRVVSVFRAYSKYLRQCGVSHSYSFMAQTLEDYPKLTAALARRFDARFNPEVFAEERQALMRSTREGFDASLEEVSTLDADRLLRMFSSLIEATDRTNFYLDHDRLSFKLRPRSLDFTPHPRPLHEIWVYSPSVEGVHLRFGDIARGGLRWSDRKEDFRTEILGLVKAQAVKNAVIVPDGAKGGFFAKKLPDPALDRAAWMAEGQSAYRSFIRGLLDLTDNRAQGKNAGQIIAPVSVVRHDADDPYLVVAADKGTASFSDMANSISEEYDFWLKDAFASGGSVGYDHKAMAITARGAWESVKRHFSELGVDCQEEDFTAVGIGDMSGDVFGNGMLLSEHTKLIAAFDHRHIFIDPNPDPALSYVQRKRLFELPRSSWEDYESSEISAGGGVYSRQAKSIALSEEAARALGIDGGAQQLAPMALVSHILQAPVDLLYNGGIGTYVKASHESNDSVGDRANNALRINGNQVRAKVIGEGGNLGLTQAGRIEAAMAGVLINTDAIDNSAGVDCSDHEVNIKILVDHLVAQNHLQQQERASFLASMTDEVARLVLRTNVEQNILLQADRTQCQTQGPAFERLMLWLEEHADLDRELEGLPSTSVYEARLAASEHLTSPELAVLAAYTKMSLARALSQGDFADDPHFALVIHEYFPKQIRERFAEELQEHPLRRQIIATIVANAMVNMGGITFAYRAMEETGLDLEEIARAFVVAANVYDIEKYMEEVAALPAHFDVATWNELMGDIRRLIDRTVRWFVANAPKNTTIDETVERFAPIVKPLSQKLGQYLVGDDAERERQWYERALRSAVPEPLSRTWSSQFESFALLDIVRISEQTAQDPQRVAQVYFLIYDRFSIDQMLTKITALARSDRWQTMARAALRDDLYSVVADLTVAVLTETRGEDLEAGELLRQWEQEHSSSLQRARQTLEEVKGRADIASMSVALRLMRSIVRY